MGKKLVTLKMDSEVLDLVDSLVGLGLFSSRSEAVKWLIRAGAAGLEPLARVARGVNKLLELERSTGSPAFWLRGGVERLPSC